MEPLCGYYWIRPSRSLLDKTITNSTFLGWIVRRLALLLYAQDWKELRARLDALKKAFEGLKAVDRPPEILQAMLVSGEDHRFYAHCGVDPFAICRATWRTLILRRREGASTIEMQLVRVLTGHYEKALSRKCREAFLATLLAHSIPKNLTASFYLFVAYYGTGMEGFTRAIRMLGIHPHEMTTRQAAALASRLKYPEPRRYSVRRSNQIHMRTEYLLHRYQKYFDKNPANGMLRQESHATI